ncbi:pilin [Thiolapillus brandeum]|uniref:DUF2066 domain-containing protein n=1 Tax=Thiolapillus brandeum TaxID=1076588 RepID=A0A7U6GLB9_9GAMM|nr:pilin [Thiolapillus brandeum]BAO45750.1 hypothetical protein TBH_C2849 [Thiolapillus brandeum]
MKRILVLLLICLSGTSLAQTQAPLRLSMPEDAIAYLRLMGQTESSDDQAHTRLQEVLQSLSRDMNLRAALAADLEKQPELVQQHPWLDLLAMVEAPAELVVLWPTGATAAQGRILVRGRSRLASEEVLNQMLARISQAVDGLQLIQGFGGKHVASLRWEDKMDLLLVLDPASRVFYLLAGEGVTGKELQDRVAGLVLQQTHPMLALEQRIDTTATGPFLWLDMPRALYAWTLYAKPAPEMRQRLGLFAGVRAAALGWGRRNGRGRLSLVVDAPGNMGLAGMLPPVKNDYSSLYSRGEPKWLLALNLPGQGLQQMLDSLVQASLKPGEDIPTGKQALGQALGVDPDRLVAGLGPETVLFSDQAGIFLAVRNTDPDAVQQLLDHATANYSVEHRIREFGGRSYHHLNVWMLPEEAAKPDQDPLDAYVREFFVRDHLYWVRDGQWLIFARLPQPLFDRYRLEDKTALGDWLKTHQRQRTENALLLISARIDDVPRMLYYGYLTVYQSLADLLDMPFDPFAFPGAMDLELPDQGSYGVQLDLSDPYLTLEFSFEDNPLEILSGGNTATNVAMLGIVASVAIPAYKDYLSRSRIGEAMNLAAVVKNAVAEYQVSTGHLPVDAAQAGVDTAQLLAAQKIIASLKVTNGRIVITFGEDDPGLSRKTLILTPYGIEDQGSVRLVWRCGNSPEPAGRRVVLATQGGKTPVHVQSSLPARLLPKSCR